MSHGPTEAELRSILFRAIRKIAPEVDPESLDPDLPIRDQVDLDSMDAFHLLVAVGESLKLEIPETDYAEFATLNRGVAYLLSRKRSGETAA